MEIQGGSTRMLDNYGGIIEEDIAEYILKRNAEQSAKFMDPSEQASRRLYRAKHPTEILVAKCMDGRLNLSLYTETPPGIIQPFRNIGGKFNVGWPFFQEVINDAANYAIGKARQCILMSSYHFSKGDLHRGCAGHNYDTDAAQSAAFQLREQYTRVYGDAIGRPIYGLTIGIETDEEALVFHGADGEELRVALLDQSTSSSDIVVRLKLLYPDMNALMMADLVPLIEGNMRHIARLRDEGREPIDLEHREQVIAVGRGFDWLHEPNTALIIGPYSHAWREVVATAGQLVLKNITEHRIPTEPGILLLVAALHRQEDGSAGWRLKEEKVKYLLTESRQVLCEEVPELTPHLKILAGVVNADTRKFHPIKV